MKKLSLSLLSLALLGTVVGENSVNARITRKNSFKAKKNKNYLRKKLSLKDKKFLKKNKNPRRRSVSSKSSRNQNISSVTSKSIISSGKILEKTQEILKLLNETNRENYAEKDSIIKVLLKENKDLSQDLSIEMQKAIIGYNASFDKKLTKLPEICHEDSNDSLNVIKIDLKSICDKLILDITNYQKEEKHIQDQKNTKKKLEQKNHKNNTKAKTDSKKDKKESEGFFSRIVNFFSNLFRFSSKKDEKKTQDKKSSNKKANNNKRKK